MFQFPATTVRAMLENFVYQHDKLSGHVDMAYNVSHCEDLSLINLSLAGCIHSITFMYYAFKKITYLGRVVETWPFFQSECIF